MRLVIISNMAHYRRDDGVLVGHGATSRELSALAALFDQVRHVACLHDEPAPASALPYTTSNLELVPVPPAGGEGFDAKLDILRRTPLYARTILHELRSADAVHVRCPANISLYAVMLLAIVREPQRRWIKYAGDWNPPGIEPLSYRLQRRLLKRSRHRAQVTVNGTADGEPAHVHGFINPCLTDDEMLRGREVARDKQLVAPIRLVFVGHLGAAKNPRVAIDALAELRHLGIDARLDLVGDGIELAALRAFVVNQGLERHVILHGALPHTALDALYAAAHFIVLPSRTEGWPKVLSEGMATGALPIATAVGSIPELLARFRVGRALRMPADPLAFAAAIQSYLADPAGWRREVDRAVVAAGVFTFSSYQNSVRTLLEL